MPVTLCGHKASCNSKTHGILLMCSHICQEGYVKRQDYTHIFPDTYTQSSYKGQIASESPVAAARRIFPALSFEHQDSESQTATETEAMLCSVIAFASLESILQSTRLSKNRLPKECRGHFTRPKFCQDMCFFCFCCRCVG